MADAENITAGLSDIIGQDDAVGRLQQMLSAKRVPHAFIFSGPEGVGKRTTAIATAATLLCESPVTVENSGQASAAPFIKPCGKCADCKMLRAQTHGDLKIVRKELARYHENPDVRNRKMQKIPIGVIEAFLIKPARMAPARGKGIVFIVLEAELMSNEAQNSMLKTLEEPPPGVKIILVTQSPDALLPTTLSRCAMIRFGFLPGEFVRGKLLAAGIEQDEAEFWASFTRGSIGRAMRLSEQGLYEIKTDVLDKLSAMPPAGDAELGTHLTKVMDKIATQIVSEEKKDHDADLAKTVASRRAAATMIGLITSAYSDAIMLATGAQIPIVNADQPQTVRMISKRFSPVQLARIIEDLESCQRLLWRNVNAKTVWDNAVITCATAAPLNI